jgi:hypothetical protein
MSENENGVAASQEIDNRVNKLKNKLEILFSEVELAVELVQEAEITKDRHAAKMEEKELEAFDVQYFSTYEELVQLCKKHNLPDASYVQRRKEFVSLVFRTKLQIARLQAEPEAPTSRGDGVRLKLPKIDFDSFAGKKEEWMGFKKLFMTYIHENTEMSAFEKQRFLRSKVKDEPATLIESFPIDGSAYNEAWKVLLNHYDDPLKKISRHMDAMFRAPPTKNTQLRSLITNFRAQVTALNITFEEHKTEIDVLSQFSIYAFLSKADKGTRLDWERELERRQKFATFDEFIKFMEGRCNAYERAMGSSITEVLSTPHVKGSAMVNTTRTRHCNYCNASDHAMYWCGKFLNLTPEEQCRTVRKKRLCLKCF